MKKLLNALIAGLLAVVGLFTFTACNPTGKDANIKGYEGDVVGVDIYLMALVCEELDMKMEVKDVDFDGIVGAVATKDNAVGAAGITINDERKQSVDFSNAYYSSVQYIISKSGEAFTSLEALAGKKIGVQKGTTGALMVADAIETAEGALYNTGAQAIEYDTGAVAFTAMKQNKCDYVVIDELPAQKLVYNDTTYVANAIAGIEVEEYGLCVSKTSTLNADIIAAMNKVIAETDMSNVVAYYTSIANGEEPTVTIKAVNLADNKGDALEVYTCSGFEPYEFVVD
ncbi:MAG: transporter substrate-binding domain-containing protein [Clostridia bacterium]|nr:transporter substrate-binding domain-containing protein [Clostridia bacterium]